MKEHRKYFLRSILIAILMCIIVSVSITTCVHVVYKQGVLDKQIEQVHEFKNHVDSVWNNEQLKQLKTMQVKDLIKILCDFNPNAEVEVVYNNQALQLIGDYGWDFGGDVEEGTHDRRDVVSVFLHALDEKQAREHEETLRKQMYEAAPCKGLFNNNE